MELKNLNEVGKLNERRNRQLELFKVARGTASIACRILPLGCGDGAEINAGVVISDEVLLAAIVCATADNIVLIDGQLKALGVMPPDFRHPAAPESGDVSTSARAANYWREQTVMFRHAWDRELGPRQRCAHFIDTLVHGTRALRQRAEDAEFKLKELQAAIDETAEGFLPGESGKNYTGPKLERLLDRRRQEISRAKELKQ